jgi:hypothetical protein
MKLLILIAALLPILLVMTGTTRAGPPFPGPRPGLARGELKGNQVLLENDLLSVRWDFVDGLRLLEATDKQTGKKLATGPTECLQLTLIEAPAPDPRVLKASQMQVLSPPVLRDAEVSYGTGRASDKFPGKEIIVSLAAPDRSVTVEWRATLRDESNYVRQTFVLCAGADWVEVNEVMVFEVAADDAEVCGSVDGSPARAGGWFIGFEHPMSRSEIVADGAGNGPRRVKCIYPFAPPLAPGARQEYSSVLGMFPKDQLRRAFLYYLERERAHPYRPFLHHNAGEDMGHTYNRLGRQPEELKKFQLQQGKVWQQVMEDFGRELVTKRNVVIDSFAHDYLWDDPRRPWLFDGDIYPQGWTEARLVAAKYGANLGVWFSPDAVTGTRGRVPAAIEQKFEGYRVGTSGEAYTMGLSLGGPRYFARFRNAVVNMLRNNGAGYFKFDGIADGYKYEYKPSGAGPFSSDFEALLQVYKDLRALDPNVFINSSTGAWPSPFILRWADSIWHQGADVGLYGPEFEGFARGVPRQRWITYRDSATYHNGLLRGPLYPLNSYMVHGLEYNLCSTGEGRQRVRGLEAKDFIDEVRSFFASGTNLQEMYVYAGVMKPETWDALAEAAKWSRANSVVLVDTHWVGGDPAKVELYGWASWSPRKGILSLRNPDEQPRSITIDIGKTFELPDGAPQKYRLTSPWGDSSSPAAVELTAGRPHEFKLQPFEVLVLDAIPL